MKRLIYFFVVMILMAITNLQSATIYVNVSASGNNNGTSWSDAYASFQSALNLAISGDQIWVAKGTYKPESAYDLTNTSRFYHFRLKIGVSINGGFAGTETALSQRTNFGAGQTNETILSGDLSGNDDYSSNPATNISENCYHVFYHPTGLALTSTAIIDGFTVKGGNARWQNFEMIGV